MDLRYGTARDLRYGTASSGRKARATITLFCLGTMLLLGTVVGQTNQGSIAGNVIDPSGALVGNAKITAKETHTGTTYTSVSSTSGSYRFPNVNIGTYNVTVAAP